MGPTVDPGALQVSSKKYLRNAEQKKGSEALWLANKSPLLGYWDMPACCLLGNYPVCIYY